MSKARGSNLIISQTSRYDLKIDSQIVKLSNDTNTTNNISLTKINQNRQNKTQKDCRICLQSNNQQHNQLVAPCKCTGSVKFIHQNCFIEWIMKDYENKPLSQKSKLIKEGTMCEICKSKIKVNFDIFYELISFQNFKKKVYAQTVLFFILVTIILLVFAIAIYLIYQIISGGLSFNSQKMIASIIVICGILLSIILLIVCVYQLCNDYLIQKKLKVISFGEKFKENTKNQTTINLKQIIPQQSLIVEQII